MNFESAMRLINEGRKTASPNMRLGTLIAALEDRPEAQHVRFDFCGFTPTGLHSYRGFYEDLAISYGRPNYDFKVADLLRILREAVGETFTGWKGGEYTMTKDTLIWVSESGESWQTAVVGVVDGGYVTILATQYHD